MVQSIHLTSVQPKSCLRTAPRVQPKRGRNKAKRVKFTRDARQQAKKQVERPSRCLPRQKEETPIIGKSCTWGSSELDHLKVNIRQDVNSKEMIPERFFEFAHLERYSECIIPLLCLTNDSRSCRTLSALRKGGHRLQDCRHD
jgi:hypothetical protein